MQPPRPARGRAGGGEAGRKNGEVRRSPLSWLATQAKAAVVAECRPACQPSSAASTRARRPPPTCCCSWRRSASFSASAAARSRACCSAAVLLLTCRLGEQPAICGGSAFRPVLCAAGQASRQAGTSKPHSGTRTARPAPPHSPAPAAAAGCLSAPPASACPAHPPQQAVRPAGQDRTGRARLRGGDRTNRGRRADTTGTGRIQLMALLASRHLSEQLPTPCPTSCFLPDTDSSAGAAAAAATAAACAACAAACCASSAASLSLSRSCRSVTSYSRASQAGQARMQSRGRRSGQSLGAGGEPSPRGLLLLLINQPPAMLPIQPRRQTGRHAYHPGTAARPPTPTAG